MIVNVEFTCPVSVIVDTDTGEVDKVIVWDESLDTTKPTAFNREDYIAAGHPEYAAQRAKLGDYPTDLGIALHEALPELDPERGKALEVIRGDAEWPAWSFGP